MFVSSHWLSLKLAEIIKIAQCNPQMHLNAAKTGAEYTQKSIKIRFIYGVSLTA